jgi:hypothetical protein
MTFLTLCVGIFMGGCVQLFEFQFADMPSCEQARSAQLPHLRGGWAVCSLKRTKP